MNKIVVAGVLILGFGLVACRRSTEEHPVSWLNPSDQALLDAATAGFQGKDPEPIWIYRSEDPTLAKCLERVSGVALFTPLWNAQWIGYYRRKEFNPAPTLADTTGVRYSPFIVVHYGSQTPQQDEANVAISVGESIFKPAGLTMLKPETVICTTEVTTGLAVKAQFVGPNALPTSGKGTIIVRRNGKEDVNIDIDFDSIPSSFNIPQQ